MDGLIDWNEYGGNPRNVMPLVLNSSAVL
jgi:hypothetical protein